MNQSFSFGSEGVPEDQESIREELANNLRDLREIPGCPIGEDADLVRMSLPATYTAMPNPFLAEWLKASPSADSTEYQDPGPFTSDVTEGKGHLLYKAHSFHTKVPHQAIMRFLLHYTKPGDVVLDGFCGSGMTGIAAQACGNPEPKFQRTVSTEMSSPVWGARRAVLQDLSPAATFIAAGLNQPVDGKAFDKASKDLLDAFDVEHGWMYETRHSDASVARIDYTVWSEVFTCPHCGNEVVFYDVAFIEDTGRVRDEFHCSSCGAELTKDGLERRKVSTRTLAGDVANRIEFRPVRIHYRLGGQKYAKLPDDEDLKVLRRIAGLKPSWFPRDPLPLDDMAHGSRLGPKGFTHIHHLWSDRAVASLSALWGMCNEEKNPRLRAALLFWVEQALWGLSWMNRYKVIQFGRPGGSLVNQYMTGVYYVPSLSAECSVRYNLEGSQPTRGKRQSLVKTWTSSPARSGQVMISTGSSERIDLPDESVDYVFVDPPFGSNIPYADLDLVIESWHRVFTSVSREAILDKSRGKGMVEYQAIMERCFKEFYRVLKPGRWMTVEFSNSSNEVWLTIQEALARAGFVVADTRVFDKSHHSYRQVTARNAVKQDLIISGYRPAEDLEDRFSVTAGSEEGAWEFIREHLRHLERFDGTGQTLRVVRERQADRLYDRMVGFHVHHGVMVPLTAAEFYGGLDVRFPVRDEMYFLPEQVEAYERTRMSVKELIQTELFITSEASAILWLRQQLKRKPQTFAQVQPPFFDELQAGPPEWENLPDLKQILDENFLQDEKGRWYVPDPRKASDLEKVRAKSLLKEFNRYVESKGKLERFRSEAVRAGFRDAWSQRDFHMIISVGNRLPVDAFAEDQSLQHYYNNAKQQAR